MRSSGLARLALAAVLLAPAPLDAAPRVALYLFYGEGCWSCQQEKEFLAGLQGRVSGLDVVPIEAMRNPANGELLAGIAARYGVTANGVPVSFIGPFPPIVGFRDAASTGALIEAQVRHCLEHGCEDPVGPLVAAGTAGRDTPLPAVAPAEATAPPDDAGDTLVRLPLLGPTDLRRLPLVTLTVALGAVDGFNPCAFFVLFTLLGILVHARSRGRMLLVGGTFVLCSGLLYFLFMAAWLNVFRHLGQLRAVTAGAGVAALAIAAVNVKDFFLLGTGVSLSIPEGRKPGLYERMRALLRASSLPALLAGTLALAVAANTYELLCTAGFPMVYTRILTLHDLPQGTRYLLLALYNTVYVLPLAAVVAVFVASLGSRKLGEEQARALKLLSGLMMLGLGGALLVDPGLFASLKASIALFGGALLATAAIVAARKRLLGTRGPRRPPAAPGNRRGGEGPPPLRPGGRAPAGAGAGGGP